MQHSVLQFVNKCFFCLSNKLLLTLSILWSDSLVLKQTALTSHAREVSGYETRHLLVIKLLEFCLFTFVWQSLHLIEEGAK